MALDFFSRERYDKPLDLYCQFVQTVHVGVWLQYIGYKYTPRENQSLDFLGDFHQLVVNDSWRTSDAPAPDNDPEEDKYEPINAIWEFRRNAQVIHLVSVRCPPLQAILSFQSSTYENASLPSNANL